MAIFVLHGRARSERYSAVSSAPYIRSDAQRTNAKKQHYLSGGRAEQGRRHYVARETNHSLCASPGKIENKTQCRSKGMREGEHYGTVCNPAEDTRVALGPNHWHMGQVSPAPDPTLVTAYSAASTDRSFSISKSTSSLWWSIQTHGQHRILSLFVFVHRLLVSPFERLPQRNRGAIRQLTCGEGGEKRSRSRQHFRAIQNLATPCRSGRCSPQT